MTLLTVLCFALLPTLAFAQQFETVHSKEWINNSWVNNAYTEYTYDGECRRTSITRKDWDTTVNSWLNLFRFSFTYTPSGNLEMETTEVGVDSTSWEPNSRLVYTFNGYDEIDTIYGQSWNGANWVTKNYTKHSYDAGNYLIQTVANVWDTTTSSYVEKYKHEYTNYSNGLVETATEFMWNATLAQWSVIERYSYEYTPEGFQSLIVHELWWGATGTWVNNWKSIRTYNAFGKMETMADHDWDGSAWVNDHNEYLFYDANGSEMLHMCQNLSPVDSLWHTVHLITNLNDANGNIISAFDQGWDETTGNLENHYFTTYTHTCLNSTSVEGLQPAEKLVVYPNPSNGQFMFRNDNQTTGDKIMLTNALGAVVFERDADEPTLSVTEKLPPGIYALSWLGQTGWQTVKIVIQ